MDERLRAAERGGRPAEVVRARRQAGLSEAAVWAGVVTPELPYADAVELAETLEGLRFLEVEGATARFLHEATELVLRLLPGGRFCMGSMEGSPNERPVHEVTVAPFLVAETPCTQRAWDRGSVFRSARDRRDVVGERLAVVTRWDAAKRWCDAVGLRLPSEAEWEYACRAGTETAYCCGDAQATVEEYGWCFPNSEGEPQEVGQLAPNAWGLRDVHGGVLEWCRDVYVDTYEGAPCDGSAREGASASRVLRGGSWVQHTAQARSACRNWLPKQTLGETTGLRPARTLSSLAALAE